MIDVDEQGRAAAADLNRAAAAVAAIDAAWIALQRVGADGSSRVDPVRGVPWASGSAAVAVRARARGRRAGWAVLAAGAAAAITALLTVALVVRRDDGGEVRPIQPGPTATNEPVSGTPMTPTPSAPGASATTAPADTVPGTSVAPAPTTSPPGAVVGPITESHPLRDVERAADLPMVVVGAGEAAETAALLEGVGIGNIVAVHDVANIDGGATVLFTAEKQCATPPCGHELAVAPRHNADQPRVIIGYGGGVNRSGFGTSAATGRFSLSDSGIAAGVVQLDGRSNVGFLMLYRRSGPEFGQLLDQGSALGFNGTATADPSRRRDAAAIDQTGRAVAWLDAAGITVVDLVTMERRTIPLAARPVNPLPALDIAIAGASIADGAVLLSAPGEPAYVIDLTDESVTTLPDLLDTLTFRPA